MLEPLFLTNLSGPSAPTGLKSSESEEASNLPCLVVKSKNLRPVKSEGFYYFKVADLALQTAPLHYI